MKRLKLTLSARLMLATIAPAALMVVVLLFVLPAVANSRIGGSKYRTIEQQRSLLSAVGAPSLSLASAQEAINDLYLATYLPTSETAAVTVRRQQARERVGRARAAFTTSSKQLTAKFAGDQSQIAPLTALVQSGTTYFADLDRLDAMLAANEPEPSSHPQFDKVFQAFTANQVKAAALADRVRAETAAVEADAGTGVLVGVVVGALLAASLAAGAVVLGRRAVRSLLDPIGQLTRQATLAATEELPRLVDEVTNLPSGLAVPRAAPFQSFEGTEFEAFATALNLMQDTAINLAVSQAKLRRNMSESLVNLGRRNQGLLARTLSFITELEEHERNPATIADLYRLDHLTTRMRRNAESLLVLAGSEPPRTWSEPVHVGDVLRAALSEIESYDRVDLGHLDNVHVKGTAVSDMAHLLSELMENSTNFSPPSSRVHVEGQQLAEGYQLNIIDEGIGMTPEEMDEANRLLAEPTTLEAAPSKVLGHYVVSQLAARHGVRVKLQPTRDTGGVTAMIYLPAPLLAVAHAGAMLRPQAPQHPQLRPQQAPRPPQYQQQPPPQHYQQPHPIVQPLPEFEPGPVASSAGPIGAGGLAQRMRPGASQPPIVAPAVEPSAPQGYANDPPPRPRGSVWDDPAYAAPIPVPAAPAPEPVPVAPQREQPLPMRTRGSTWTDGPPAEPLSSAQIYPRSPEQVRTALSSFQRSTSMPPPVAETAPAPAPAPAPEPAPTPLTPAGLPLRAPGDTWGQPAAPQPYDKLDPRRSPEAVRAGLDAFQRGTRSAEEDKDA